MSFHIIGQPAVFMRRSAIPADGFLDLKYHFLLDHQLWLRIARNSPIKYVPKLWAEAHYHEGAKNMAEAGKFGNEALRIAEWMRTSSDFAGRLPETQERDRSRRTPPGWILSAGCRGVRTCVQGVHASIFPQSKSRFTGMVPGGLLPGSPVGLEKLEATQVGKAYQEVQSSTAGQDQLSRDTMSDSANESQPRWMNLTTLFIVALVILILVGGTWVRMRQPAADPLDVSHSEQLFFLLTARSFSPGKHTNHRRSSNRSGLCFRHTRCSAHAVGGRRFEQDIRS